MPGECLQEWDPIETVEKAEKLDKSSNLTLCLIIDDEKLKSTLR